MAGIAAGLIALSGSAAQMPLITVDLVSAVQNTDAVTLDTTTEKAWHEHLLEAAETLATNMFEVRDHSQPLTPLLTPEAQHNLQANIQLMLQTAQIAALKNEQQLYQDSLTQAEQWVLQFYDGEAPPVQSFLQQLSALRDKPVTLVLPEQLASLPVLTARITGQPVDPVSYTHLTLPTNREV